MIRAALFDLDDTLCDDRGQMYRAIQLSAEAGVGMEKAAALAEAYTVISDRYWYQELTLSKPPSLTEIRKKLWSMALVEAVGEVDEAVLDTILTRYDALRREPIPPFPGTLETLTALKSAGIRLAVLTNGLAETHFAKAEMLGITGLVEEIFTPDTLGTAKPDARAFHQVCAHLGVPPEHTVHVGDSLLTDVGGACGAGLQAVWFNPSGAPRPAEAAVPHHEITALSDLILLLTS
ncbi:MAG: HAD family hydrolase [Armatimonas sp.]